MVIYSSKLQRPTENVQPDMDIDHVRDEKIILSYLAIPGIEHYDACMKSSDVSNNKHHSPSETTDNNENSYISNTNGSSMKTPSKSKITYDNHPSIATPRKSANYKSSEKKEYSRKRKSDSTKWNQNIRKHSGKVGKEYLYPKTKKHVPAKSLKPHTCGKCKFNCAEKVPKHILQEMFNSYYGGNMTYEKSVTLFVDTLWFNILASDTLYHTNTILEYTTCR